MIYIVALLIIIDFVLMGVTYSHEKQLIKLKDEYVDKLAAVSIKLADIQMVNADIEETLDMLKSKSGVEDDLEEAERAYVKGLNNLLTYHGEEQE